MRYLKEQFLEVRPVGIPRHKTEFYLNSAQCCISCLYLEKVRPRLKVTKTLKSRFVGTLLLPI